MSPIEIATYNILNEYGAGLFFIPWVTAIFWLLKRNSDFLKIVRVKEKQEKISLPSLFSYGWRGNPCSDKCDCREIKMLYYRYHFEFILVLLGLHVFVFMLVVYAKKYFDLVR